MSFGTVMKQKKKKNLSHLADAKLLRPIFERKALASRLILLKKRREDFTAY